jgi:hypothetical protein
LRIAEETERVKVLEGVEMVREREVVEEKQRVNKGEEGGKERLVDGRLKNSNFLSECELILATVERLLKAYC